MKIKEVIQSKFNLVTILILILFIASCKQETQAPENNLSFFAVTEMFLSKHLGGRYQEIGDDFEDSSIEIKDWGNLKELDKIKS